MEDYGVIYLGSAIFKIARLLFIAMFSVHLFACIFFKVKVATALASEDVDLFYTSRNIAVDVSKLLFYSIRIRKLIHSILIWQDLAQQYVSSIFLKSISQSLVCHCLFLYNIAFCSWYASIMFLQHSQQWDMVILAIRVQCVMLGSRPFTNAHLYEG